VKGESLKGVLKGVFLRRGRERLRGEKNQGVVFL